MEPNLTIYQIAIRYIIMALFTGIGAGLTSIDGFLGTLGYVFMVIGIGLFLVNILGYDPTVGKNKDGKEEAKEDFIEQ
ncbi:MAG: hypothetical protein ACI9O4_000766 [Chitinophagales bacterium]|jgi:hypothetical protein